MQRKLAFIVLGSAGAAAFGFAPAPLGLRPAAGIHAAAGAARPSARFVSGSALPSALA